MCPLHISRYIYLSTHNYFTLSAFTEQDFLIPTASTAHLIIYALLKEQISITPKRISFKPSFILLKQAQAFILKHPKYVKCEV
jgi:hypothetical protein